MEVYLDDVVRAIPEAAEAPTFVGLAGTITTVAAVELGLQTYDREKVHHFVLSKAAAEDVFRTLATEPFEDRIDEPRPRTRAGRRDRRRHVHPRDDHAARSASPSAWCPRPTSSTAWPSPARAGRRPSDPVARPRYDAADGRSGARTSVPPLTDRVLMGPGPCNPYPEVALAMGRPMLGHLDPEFIELLDDTNARLREVFRTANQLTFPISAHRFGGNGGGVRQRHRAR